MPKRKAIDVGADAPGPATRRSTRNKARKENLEVKAEEAKPVSTTPKPGAAAKMTAKTESGGVGVSKDTRKAKATKRSSTKLTNSSDSQISSADDGPHYWLLKAEPESRIERGHDISFSIDDLASKASPEPWDGIRNYAARNNLRTMKKGDLAFFYHSSCKIPAIVGTMEIVEEHSPDLTARDPGKSYYDPKDTDPESPKWSIVKVELRRKFRVTVTLSELKEVVKTEEGEVLKNMDLLSLGRLSVGKVRKSEWEFIMGMIQRKEGELDGREV